MHCLCRVFHRFPAVAALVVAVALLAASAWAELFLRTMWREPFGSFIPAPVLWGARTGPPIYLGAFLCGFFVTLIALRIPFRVALAELAGLATGFVSGVIVTMALTLFAPARALGWSLVVLLSGIIAGLWSGVPFFKAATGFGVFRISVVLVLAAIAGSLGLLLVVMLVPARP